jgi:hypothetical protein
MELPTAFATAQPLGPPSALEAAIAAPAAVTMTVPDQERDEWCWAAVCVGVREAYEQVTSRVCEVAGEVLFGDGTSCCTNPDGCDEAMYLSLALGRLGYFAPPRVNKPLDFGEIADQIALGRPVCCFIDYGTAIGHFIVISAVDPATKSVGVLDPDPNGPHVSPDFVTHAALVASYGQSPSGRWKETYRTQP